MKALAHGFIAAGATRTHSAAMSFEYMDQIHKSLEPELANEPKTLDDHERRGIVLWYLAFSSFGFNIWTRYALSCSSTLY